MEKISETAPVKMADDKQTKIRKRVIAGNLQKNHITIQFKKKVHAKP
jgi:hypothetical protein